MKVPWPMDTDRPDELVAGLTAHHLLLAAPGLTTAVVGTWLLVAHVIALWVGILGLAVVGSLTVLVVAGNPDGLTWDRWLVALIRFRRAPHIEVSADLLTALPKWVDAAHPDRVEPLDLPWGSPGGRGIPLGRDRSRGELGWAQALRLSALDDSALGEEGVHQVVAALASWLASLEDRAQVLVTARPLALGERIAALEERATSPGLAPMLATIARQRADALREVEEARPRSLLAIAVLRAPDAGALAERVERAIALLASAGIAAIPLTPEAASGLLGGGSSNAAEGAPPGWPGPGELERVSDQMLRVGTRYCATLRALAYPAAVSPGWLMPVLRSGVDLDLAMHVSPEDPAVALAALRRQHGRMASTAGAQEEGGNLADPQVSGAATDAEAMHEAVGRNETRSFRAGLYVTVWAGDEDELEASVRQVAVKARGLALELTPVIFAPLEGWIGTRPLALDPVSKTWRTHTEALAAALPVWTREVESDQAGSLVGFHPVTNAPVFVDRFALDARRANAHKLAVAPSGRGKSFEIHAEIVSLLLEGVQVRVVDLENEYVRAAEALGGTVIRLGSGTAGINPFELAEAGDPGAVTAQALFIEALLATMLGGLGEEEQATIARAVMDCYRLAGIGPDPASHGRTPPQLLDLEGALQEAGAAGVAARLEPWIFGSHAWLFSGLTDTRPSGDLVVWALGDLPSENERLQAAAVLAIVHATWSEIARQDRRRRVVVLDEAWRIWETSAEAGTVLERLARRLAKGARKYGAGLTNATQDLDEFAATTLGRTVLNNSAIRWLPGQEEAALPRVAETFRLTGPERRFLAGCARGQGLYLAGRQRCRLEVRVTAAEHRLATSDPDELARIDAEELRTGAEAAAAAWVAELTAECGRGEGQRLASRHQLAALDGDWMAGRARGVLELAWSDGAESWGEVVSLSFVREGVRWLVDEAVRGPEPHR